MTNEVPVMRIAEGTSDKAIPRKIVFTVEALARITCLPGRRDIHVYDTKTPGLAYRITNNNARSFYLCRRVGRRPQRMRLGGPEMTIEIARRTAQQLNGEIATGSDPLALKRAMRKSETLQELFDRYAAEHSAARCTPRTRITDQSRFDTCLTDLASKRVLNITESDVRALHLRIGKERGQVSANRAVQLLRRLFNWARLGVNPASRSVDMFREQSRDRFVQPAELPGLFKALDGKDINPLIRDFCYCCLYTGARRSNVAAMKKEQIDLAAKTWTIPAKASKNHEPMTIPLAEPALKIIKRRLKHPSGFIFPGPGKSGHLEDPKATWKKVLERASLADIRLHDLRRTFGSFQAALGSSLPVIGRSLGHRNTAATAIYSRLHLDPVRASVNQAVGAIVAAGGKR